MYRAIFLANVLFATAVASAAQPEQQLKLSSDEAALLAADDACLAGRAGCAVELLQLRSGVQTAVAAAPEGEDSSDMASDPQARAASGDDADGQGDAADDDSEVTPAMRMLPPPEPPSSDGQGDAAVVAADDDSEVTPAMTPSVAVDPEGTGATAGDIDKAPQVGESVESTDENITFGDSPPDGGYCSFGSGGVNMCNGCTEWAKAGTECDHEDSCGGCGGSWCVMRCVFAGAEPDNICGTAYWDSVAESDHECGITGDSCESCGGAWCGLTHRKLPPTDDDMVVQVFEEQGPDGTVVVGEDKVPFDEYEEERPERANLGAYGAYGEDGPGYYEDGPGYYDGEYSELELRNASENASAAGSDHESFCCYAGDGDDKCGSCYPGARAPPGHYCDGDDKCGGCGGTWCIMQCVLAASDPNDVCNNAYAVAEPENWCAQTEDKCNGCGGTWCGHTVIVN